MSPEASAAAWAASIIHWEQPSPEERTLMRDPKPQPREGDSK